MRSGKLITDANRVEPFQGSFFLFLWVVEYRLKFVEFFKLEDHDFIVNFNSKVCITAD